MNNGNAAIVGILLVAAFLLPLTWAEPQTTKQTETVTYSLNDGRTYLTVGEGRSFYKNMNISSFDTLHDFTVDLNSKEGVSKINVTVQTLLCGTETVPVIGNAKYVCTTNLTSNLSATLLNITVKNIGYAASGNQTVTLEVIQGRFTVDRGTTFNFSTLTQGQLDALNTSINAHTTSRISQLYTDITTWITSNVGSLVWNYSPRNVTTTGGNVTINGTQVWDIIYNSTRTNKTQGTLLIDDWAARFFGTGPFKLV